MTAPSHDVVVIGAGTAGLAASRALTERGIPHVVLERGRIGETWRCERWDSFTMVTPTWRTGLRGLAHEGCDPDGFLTLGAWLDYLDRYTATRRPPVRESVTVRAVRANRTGRFLIQTEDEDLVADAVIAATGFYRAPVIPPCATRIPPSIAHLPAKEYRNPGALPEGAVLVVGTGQTGSQIAEELNAAGRKVYLSVGRIGRTPRRYRGRDVYWWRIQPGFALGFRERPESVSHITGKDGGRELNLHRFARDGVLLLGRLEGIEDSELLLAPDLHQRLAEADSADLAFRRAADAYVSDHQLGLPLDPQPNGEGLGDGFALPLTRRLDLRESGIGSVIWATGFRPDYSWLDLPVLDGQGHPICERGVTVVPGCYFAGTRWQLPDSTTLIGGVDDEADFIAAHIANRRSGKCA